MARRAPTPQTPPPGDQPAQPGPGQDARPPPAPQEGAALKLPALLARTVRHFFPDFNTWLDQLPDSREAARVVYPRRLLAWYGLALYLFQLGSRRNLDFHFSTDSQAPANLHRLAGTAHDRRPVHDTLDHFIGHSRPQGFARLRRQAVGRLIRNKLFEPARLQGRLRVALDATGQLAFRRRHCPRCLVQQHAQGASYLHQVLEAKLLGPAGLAVSVGSAFIENADLADTPAQAGAEQRKQDCELKAFARLAPALKADFPQTRLVLTADSLYACGPFFQACKERRWSFVAVFKPGRTPALYAEFVQLLALCPQNSLQRRPAAGVLQQYRWVVGLPYTDSNGRTWQLNALRCEETVDGQTTTFAWLTDLVVQAGTVAEVAQAGRDHWAIENEGFNRQKNSGLNLEHVYSSDPERAQSYYLLLQLAHLLLQLLEKGSLLQQLAQAYGCRTWWQLFGSLKNLAERLREGMRWGVLPSAEAASQAPGQIRLLDTS